MQTSDIIIVGAGAAGLMCAIEAGKRGRRVIILDHANKVGKKILMSGGGRCNFTNYHINPDCYISHNPHFCKSALSRYTQWDFIELVQRHKIPYHEKTLGQLFCDHKSKDIVEMLLHECEQANIKIHLETHIQKLGQLKDYHFKVITNKSESQCESLIIASGGLSIPTMGASPFAYKIAEQFGINVWPTRAGLVPVTLHLADKEKFAALSGVSIDALVSNDKIRFRENILFTHRGMSGPAILQISSYWQPGEIIHINLLPEIDLFEQLKQAQQRQSQKQLQTYLADYLPKRVLEIFINNHLLNMKLVEISHYDFKLITTQLQDWQLKPNGTEGYRTAEITLGGVDCDALSSKTFEAKTVAGLYFIGEAIDVSGWLGGYNFQWAWSSGWAAGQVA